MPSQRRFVRMRTFASFVALFAGFTLFVVIAIDGAGGAIDVSDGTLVVQLPTDRGATVDGRRDETWTVQPERP
jgi:hypothetical protein